MTLVTVLEIPQWQGSGSATARRLPDGAAQLARLLPAGEHIRVATTDRAAPTLEGVTAKDALVSNFGAAREALARARGELVVTVGGDCGVDLAPIEAALARHGRNLAVVWFDAHPDLNTPDSSPSGSFHGMVLRTLLGDGPPALVPAHRLCPEQVVLAGTRALDPPERAFVERSAIASVGVPALADPASVVDAVAATGATAIYLHIDLDVLDPGSFASVGARELGGLSPDQLAAAVHALAARFAVAGIGITEYEPPPAGPAGPELRDGSADRITLDRLLAGLPLTLSAGNLPDGPARIERFAAAAWPAATVAHVDGWLLRHTPGVTRRRSNSALPPPATTGPECALPAVATFYRERGSPPLVQVSPAEHHTTLDSALAGNGYHRQGATLVLTAPASQVAGLAAGVEPVTVGCATAPDDSWLRAFVALDEHTDRAQVAEHVLRRIPAPAAYLTATRAGQLAGIGLFVGAPGWAGGYCMVTDPRHRRRGVGRAVLAAGARWAADHRVSQLYVLVEPGNQAARALYEAAGFRHSHGYHYRAAGPAAG